MNTVGDLIARKYKGPVGLPRRCELQNCTNTKLECLCGCLAVTYCSQEHLNDDLGNHQKLHFLILIARVKAARQEVQARSEVPGGLKSDMCAGSYRGRPFDEFGDSIEDLYSWGGPQLRLVGYMRARDALRYSLIATGTRESVEEALDHALDMLDLDDKIQAGKRWDVLPEGVRGDVPGLLLRLNRDRECYDFLGALRTNAYPKAPEIDESAKYGYNESIDFLGADIFDSPFGLVSRRMDRPPIVVVLKLKILMDIRNIRVARKVLPEYLPAEIRGMIGFETLESTFSAGFPRESTESSPRRKRSYCSISATSAT